MPTCLPAWPQTSGQMFRYKAQNHHHTKQQLASAEFYVIQTIELFALNTLWILLTPDLPVQPGGEHTDDARVPVDGEHFVVWQHRLLAEDGVSNGSVVGVHIIVCVCG